MKSVLNVKSILIILASFILSAAPLFAQSLDGAIPETVVRVSANTAASSSAGNLLDGDYSSFWALEAGVAAGWAEIGFDKPCFVFGLDLTANLPSGAILAAEYFQNDEWHAFSGSHVTGVNVSKLFYDFSFDRAVTDRVRVRLSGSSAANAKVYELAFRGRDRLKILTRVKPVEIEASDNTSFLFPAENLCDGSVYTEWKTSVSFHGFHQIFDADPEEFKDHIRRHGFEERCLPPDRPDSSVVFDLGREITLDSIRIYLSASLHGDTTVFIGDDHAWKKVETIPEGSASGWHRIDLHAAAPRATRVKIAKEYGSGRLHEGIAEVEIWGYGAFAGDVFAETGLEAGSELLAPLNSAFYLEESQDLRLELGLDLVTSENLKVEVNGRVFDNPALFIINGKSIACYVILKKYLWKGDNYMRVRPAIQAVKVESVRVRLAAETPEEIGLPGALGDRLLFQPVILPGEQIFQFGRTMLLQQIEAFGWDPGSVKLSAWVNDEWREINFDETEPGVLLSRTVLATDKIKIGSAGAGPGELRILASPTLDSPTCVTIFWPKDGDEIELHDLEHGKLIGYVDNPAVQVTVNGKPAAKYGHYFWIDLEDVAVVEDGVYMVTAEAKDGVGRTGTDTAEFTLGMPANFRLDQSDAVIYTEQPTIVISGHAPASQYLVTVNGLPTDQDGSRFSRTVDLEVGFNLIKVSVQDKHSGALLRSASVRVVRTTGAIRVTITSPLNDMVVNSSTITVSGRVEGASGSVTATVNGKKADVKGARYVSQPVPLIEGNNVITVTAKDAAGKIATAQVTVTRDTTKPVLSDIQPSQDKLYTVSTMTVTGKVSDAGKVWVTANGLQATVASGTFSLTLTLLDGKQVIAIEAEDAAGNRSVVYNLRVVVDTAPPADFIVTPDPAGWTNNPRPVITFSTIDAVTGVEHYELKVDDGAYTTVTSPYTLPAQADGEHLVFVKAVDKAGWTRISSTKVYIDTTAPGVPGNFRPVPGKDKIILKWQKPAEDVVQFVIYRDTNPDNFHAQVDGDSSLFIDAPLTITAEYRYRLQAVDRAGNKSPFTDWKKGVVGITQSLCEPGQATLSEYENLVLVVPKDSFAVAEGVAVKWIEVSEIQSENLAATAVWGTVSPLYNISVCAEKDGKLIHQEHINLTDDYLCMITYDSSRLPLAFGEENLGVYYYDQDWAKWFRVAKCAVDKENHVIYFRTNHFSAFSIQPTMIEDLSPQELQDVGYSPLKTKSVHEGVSVSPQGGSAMTQMTELVLPGKNGFDFVLKRGYDSATARGDALGIALNLTIKLNFSNLLSSFADPYLLGQIGTQLGGQFEQMLKNHLQNCGDYAYSMGNGWRLNLPYIRGANSQVLIRTPNGSFHSLSTMQFTHTDDYFVYRELRAENHEGEDFSLVVHQTRLDINVTGLISHGLTGGTDKPGVIDDIKYAQGFIQIPGWVLVDAAMTMKDGTKYLFDALGRVTKITDSQGLNEINFHYNLLSYQLESVTDSMGRVIRFEYNSNYFQPRISKIRVEGAPADQTIEYTQTDGAIANSIISIPLLSQAKDIGGRKYNYTYDFHWLVSGGGGVKINFLTLLISLIPGVGSIISNFLPSAVELHGNIQSEFLFTMNEMWGPGIGDTVIHNKQEPLFYGTVEGADYLFGIIPTAIDISYQLINRMYTEAVDLYETRGGSKLKTTTYTYLPAYKGDGQFITSNATENDGRQIKEYTFASVKKTRDRRITWSDWVVENINGALFTDWGYYTEYVPYNTLIITNNAANDYFHTKQTLEWDTATMRLLKQRLEFSDTNFQESRYTYDSWANPVYVKETNRTGDRISETETWSHYYNTSSTPVGIFSTWPAPYSTPNVTRETHNLKLGQVIKNNPPPEAGITGPTYLINYFNYSSLGQMTATSQWTGTNWAETTFTYNPVHGSLESVTKPNGHVTQITHDFDFGTHPGSYTVTTAEKNVKNADGQTADIVSAKAFDFTHGNLLWEKNPRGFVTQTEYDGLGRVTKITEPDDDQGEISWDPRVTTERPNGANNPVTSIQYNDTELWSKVINAKLKTIFYDYDNLGRLVRIEKENAGNPAFNAAQIKKDSWNNIIEITDPNGNTTNYEYDFTGRMTGITYPAENGSRPQKTMSFDYSTNTLTSVDERGGVTKDVLDFKGNLLQREQYNGLETFTSFGYYDSLGNQILAIDPMGNRATNVYDCRNLLERSILPQASFFENGATVTDQPYIRYEYDISGVKTKDIADTPNGEHEVVYETDGLGRVIRAKTAYTDPVSGPVQAAQETYYDAKGNPVRVIDANNTPLKRSGEPYYCTEIIYSAKDKPLFQAVNVKRHAAGNLLEAGNITRLTYDELGNVLSMTDPRGTSGTYQGDFTLLYHYDDLNRLVQGDLPAGTGEAKKRIIEFIYDPRGNLLERHEPDGAKTIYTYTPRNKVSTERVRDVNNTKSYTTTHKYDAAGNETYVIDNLNNETDRIYDQLNRVEAVKHQEGNSEQYKYDKNSNVIKITDGENHSTRNEYDAYKRLTATVQTIDSKEIRHQLFYDRLGNKTKDLDPNGNVNLYQYDELNRMVMETNSLGLVYTYRYDEVKNIIESVDANGTKGIYSYTPDYLVDTITYANGGRTSTFQYEYDEAGAVKSAQADGILKEYNKLNDAYTPDPYDRILSIDTTYSGKTTRIGFECDNRDRITAVVYPNGRKVNYEYNTLSELLKVPGFIEENPEYNGVGLISKLKAANGAQTEYQYDKNLRLTLLSHTDKDGAEIRSYALKYDDANNIVKKNESTYSYDELNRLLYADLKGRFKSGNPDQDQPVDLAEEDYFGESALSIQLAPGDEVKLDHNSRSVGVNLGKKYFVSRIELHPTDSNNRLHARSVKVYASEFNTDKAYHPVENVTFLTRPDGVIELRFKEAAEAKYVKVHCYFDDRDEEGNPIPISFATVGNTALKLMKVFYMTESRQEAYGYDAIGNRTRQTISSEGNTIRTDYLYYKNTSGGDSQRIRSDGTYNYEYDNNGNLIRKTEIATGNDWEYEFNLLNRLVAVYKKESTERKLVATYIYDEAGYRVRKTSTEKGTSDYVFSAHGVVLYEEHSSGDYKEYVYVFNKLFSKVEGKTAGDGSERKKYFYHNDHLGSTTSITDEGGKVVWKNDFTPFGTETGYEGIEEHDAKFTGKDYDEEISLYYFNARWYNPELGRFISQDPIKDGVNWYVYVSNNPQNFIDESGLEEKKPTWYQGILLHSTINDYLHRWLDFENRYAGKKEFYIPPVEKNDKNPTQGSQRADYALRPLLGYVNIHIGFLEIKPMSWKTSDPNDEYLKSKLEQARIVYPDKSFEANISTLSEIDGYSFETTMSEYPNTCLRFVKITLHTDPKHSGMVYYTIDDHTTWLQELLWYSIPNEQMVMQDIAFAEMKMADEGSGADYNEDFLGSGYSIVAVTAENRHLIEEMKYDSIKLTTKDQSVKEYMFVPVNPVPAKPVPVKPE